jgi:PHD/YefM family antitoxin component YafN of YafNO toxin-antitoxin module
MRTVTLEEAQARLPEIIDDLGSGEELLITRNAQPVAKLVGQQRPIRKPRRPGSAKGKLVILAEDDEHLKDFNAWQETLYLLSNPANAEHLRQSIAEAKAGKT